MAEERNLREKNEFLLLKAQFHPFGFAGVYYCFEMASSFLIGCYQIAGFPEFLASRQLM